MSRTIAIGDIHGCSRALADLLEQVEPLADDLVVLLGDFVDRGPDSRGVLEQLLLLQRRCRLVAIMGNHEEALLAARDDNDRLEPWLRMGGTATLNSYGYGVGPGQLPTAHLAFLDACRSYYESDTHFFVHASYRCDLPLEQQPGSVLRWEKLDGEIPGPHYCGKIAVVGHTPQPSGKILKVGHLVGLDTGCYLGGPLTAWEVSTGEVWQAWEPGESITPRDDSGRRASEGQRP